MKGASSLHPRQQILTGPPFNLLENILAYTFPSYLIIAPESKSTIKNPQSPAVQNPYESLKLLAANFPKLQLPLETPVERVSYISPVMNGEDETGVQEQQ